VLLWVLGGDRDRGVRELQPPCEHTREGGADGGVQG